MAGSSSMAVVGQDGIVEKASAPRRAESAATVFAGIGLLCVGKNVREWNDRNLSPAGLRNSFISKRKLVLKVCS